MVEAASRGFARLRCHHGALQVGAGLVRVAVGALVVSGELFRLNLEVRSFLDPFGLDLFGEL